MGGIKDVLLRLAEAHVPSAGDLLTQALEELNPIPVNKITFFQVLMTHLQTPISSFLCLVLTLLVKG